MITYKSNKRQVPAPMASAAPTAGQVQPVVAPKKFDVQNVYPVQVQKDAAVRASARALGQDPSAYTERGAEMVQERLNDRYTTDSGRASFRVAQEDDGSMGGYRMDRISDQPMYQQREVVPGSGRYENYSNQGNLMSPEEVAATTQGTYRQKYDSQAERDAQEQYRTTLGLKKGGKVGCGCGGAKLLYKK